ncbi:DUF4159 domain-containing protein [Candidatus Latescibacterota bacterium]
MTINNNSFKYSTSQLNIIVDKLEHESKIYYYLGHIVGIIIILFANLFIEFDGIHSIDRKAQITAIKVDLIELPPKVQNPYKNWQKQIKPREYVRRKVTSRNLPPVQQKQPQSYTVPHDKYTAVTPQEMTERIDDFYAHLNIDSIYPFDMTPDDIIPLKNQVFFDSGQFKTEIVFNPKNKKAIQGYVHFGIVWGKYLIPPDFLRVSVKHLADAINKYTNIEAIPDPVVYISSFFSDDNLKKYYSIQNAESRANYAMEMKNGDPYQLQKYSFLYLNTDKSFELSEEEKQNLGQYLQSGGFIIIENGVPEYRFSHVEDSLKQMMIDAISTVKLYCGYPPKIAIVNDYSFKPLPKYHPIYHCFFDFENGLPPGYSDLNPKSYIEGIYMGSRLVGIYTSQGYGRTWQDPKNIEQLKLGVNMVLYAITRPKGFYSVDCRRGRSVWRITNASSIRVW